MSGGRLLAGRDRATVTLRGQGSLEAGAARVAAALVLDALADYRNRTSG